LLLICSDCFLRIDQNAALQSSQRRFAEVTSIRLHNGSSFGSQGIGDVRKADALDEAARRAQSSGVVVQSRCSGNAYRPTSCGKFGWEFTRCGDRLNDAGRIAESLGGLRRQLLSAAMWRWYS
jgi:hypothetical protein